MEPFPLAWAAEARGAHTIGALQGEVTAVCTDSRQCAPGALFFALKGENTDGHAYVSQAFATGAIGAVVSQEVDGVTGPLLVVPDTTLALGKLARYYRRQFAIPVVAVTGSVGKTSTKEMIAAVLRTQCRTLASAKNYNTEIGVPMTLFGLTRTHQAAVIEMGMRGAGQIDWLARVAEPTVAVITNIGFAHMELLGSREKIAQAKSELLLHLPADGTAILPRHDPFFDTLRQRVPAGCRVLTFGRRQGEGAPEADVEAVGSLDHTNRVTVMTGGEQADLALRVPGTHHVVNALAALAAGVALGVPLRPAIEALAAWEGAEGRMAIRHAPGDLTVLDDCYNAGPESMQAALDTLRQMAQGRRVAVLGDMRELGTYTEQAHDLIGQKVVAAGVHLLVTVGALAARIATEAERQARLQGMEPPQVERFDTTEAATDGLRGLLRPGDMVLVKGSRAMAMEQIVAELTGVQGSSAHG